MIQPTKNDKNYAKDDEYYYILTRKLRGNNITDIHKNMVIASEMGSVLAKLHKAFRECETQDKFWNNSLLKEMKGWVRDVFVKNDWKYIEEDDLSQRNIRIFDLCYFVLGLLSEEEIPDIVEEWWFEILRCFFAGYDSECELLAEEKLEVPYVMESIELLFAAWFMDQNDMKCAEDAMQIYHFVKKHKEKILKTIGCSVVQQ